MVAELAHLCHCLKTQSFLPPRFHFSQLVQLPFEWPMARLSIQNVSRLAVERTLSGQRLTETWLETTCEQFAWEATFQAASLPHYFRSKHCIDSLDGFILNLWSFGRRPRERPTLARVNASRRLTAAVRSWASFCWRWLSRRCLRPDRNPHAS